MTAEVHRQYFVLSGLNGPVVSREGPVVSSEALLLHVRAVNESVRRATPSYIADSYLNELGPHTTGAAAELCLAGVWERIGDGYRSLDQDYLDQIVSSIGKANKTRWRERAATFLTHFVHV